MAHDLNAAADDASEPAAATAAVVELAPIAESQRIDVLDVLRGFALIGILMMNIEWFNRPIAVLTAPDLGLRDFDHAAGFLVKVFVEGKFYKLFSLLFGMGFAVMLLRAEEAGRPFIAWFARRAGVLLLIGLLHSVFLWTGDILHDYAIGAFLLLAVIWLRRGGTASMKLPLSIVAIAGSAHALIAMDSHVLGGYAFIAAIVAVALWLRGKDRWRFLRDPQGLLRVAVGMSLFPILMMSMAGIVEGVRRDPVDMQERYDQSEAKRVELTKAWPKREAELLAEARKIAPGDVGEKDNDEADDNTGNGSDRTAKSDADVEAEKDKDDKLPAESWFMRRERQTKGEFWEEQAMTSKSYWVATKFRARETLNGLGGAPFFALFLLLPIFMLGWWLVETGKIRNPEQHLVLFLSLIHISEPTRPY